MALTTSLVSYWKLDEASGNRVDSHGTDTLTEFNGVDSAAGLVYANAANFDSVNSEILVGAGANIGNTDATFAIWINPDDVGSLSNVTQRGGASGYEWSLDLWSDGRYRFRAASAAGEVNATFVADGGGFGGGNGPVNNSWGLAIVYHDAANDLIGIATSLNSFTRYTAAYSFGIWAGGNPIGMAAAPFYFPAYFDGQLGPAMYWSRLLTDPEITQLYNGGAGLTYAAFGPAARRFLLVRR